MKWLCSIQKYLDNTQLDGVCLPPDQRKADYIGPESVILTKRIINPVIIIPTASRECNDKWTYESKGADWECICLDGKAQSPIDLPEKEKAVLSEEKPLFNYDVVSSKLLFSSEDGLLQSGKNLRILYDRNAIRIHHPNMGKIVQIDGAVYQAEEIVFHTPAEHTINGQKFDMEMQIIHYGVSKGDIARQAILSFIFKKKPSVYNKFIDKLDFFNLPNIIDTFRDITNDLFIPSVFYTTEDEDIPVIRPFSFYTYNGSISSPPCTERTTVYVVADPIHLSPTIISLFKEALKRPDMKNGDLIVPGSGDVENNRLPQPLNGRPVYLFDHIKFNCPEYRRPKRKIVPEGHYEKRDTYKTQYAWVNSNEPSGIPGAFVVSENEAKGLGEINLQISDPTV
jgi:carbonic anhydrase